TIRPARRRRPTRTTPTVRTRTTSARVRVRVRVSVRTTSALSVEVIPGERKDAPLSRGGFNWILTISGQRPMHHRNTGRRNGIPRPRTLHASSASDRANRHPADSTCSGCSAFALENRNRTPGFQDRQLDILALADAAAAHGFVDVAFGDV